MERETPEKPDFEKMANEWITSQYAFSDIGMNAYPCNLAYKAGMERIWNDYVLPLQEDLTEAQSDLALATSQDPELLAAEKNLIEVASKEVEGCIDLKTLLEELNKYWTFDENQRHTHSWHDKQDFIEKILRGRKRKITNFES